MGIILGLLTLLLANNCYAMEETKIDQVLKSLIDYMTSTPAKCIAVLAILSVGYGTLYLGRIPKDRAVSVVMGVALIFGSATFMRILGITN